jgi:ATP-dependent DNA helicase 2 subunit 2
VNPIEDFKKMINDRKTDRVHDALRQIQAIIERYVRCSLKGDLYEKAFDCLTQMREACISEDEAPVFNKFMDKLKD